MLTQKGIERFDENRFKSRKVKGRATSSENRKFFVAVMEGTLGVVKKMLTNSGFVKLLWAYVVLARAGKTLAVGRGTRIGDGFRNVLVNSLDSRYVGRTSQRLEERIKQHVPKSITNPHTSANRQSLSRSCKNNIRPQQFHESAIGQHLLDNAQCALHYSNEKFSILARGRSSFHLSALEATFIKSLNPFLCKQKEFVYSLKIS